MLFKKMKTEVSSCIVGNIDLPSRTQWRVKINLPKDYAGFFTEAVWYNQHHYINHTIIG